MPKPTYQMPSPDQLKLLISLARVDGEVVEKERQYIINIGQANHFMVPEILPWFSDEFAVDVPANLTKDQKFEYVFTLVQLMRIDGRIYQEEIKFVSQVASKLGYRQELLFDLMLKVQEIGGDKEALPQLKQLTSEYLQRG